MSSSFISLLLSLAVNRRDVVKHSTAATTTPAASEIKIFSIPSLKDKYNTVTMKASKNFIGDFLFDAIIVL